MIRAIACLFLFSTLCFTGVVAADGSSNTPANGHSTPQSAGLLLTAEALASVVAHGPWPPALKPDPSLMPLGLNEQDIKDLVAFLKTL